MKQDEPEQEHVDAEPDEDPDDEGSSGGGAAVQEAWTPRELKKAERDRLSGLGYAMVGKAGELEWIFRGAKESSLRTLKMAAQHLETIYDAFRADQELTGLALANSIHITIGPSTQEQALAERSAAELERLAEPADHEGPEESEPEVSAAERRAADSKRRRLARATVPNTVLANSLILDLIEETTSEEEDQPLATALRYGTGVATSFRALVGQLAEDKLELEASWDLDERSVDVLPERIYEVNEALSAAGDLRTFQVSVAGTLTMADADRLEFRLKFATDTPRPDTLREWRRGTITGRFTTRMQRSLTERQLWNREVIVQLRVTREERGTSAARAKPDVRLLAAKPRFS